MLTAISLSAKRAGNCSARSCARCSVIVRRPTNVGAARDAPGNTFDRLTFLESFTLLTAPSAATRTCAGMRFHSVVSQFDCGISKCAGLFHKLNEQLVGSIVNRIQRMSLAIIIDPG